MKKVKIMALPVVARLRRRLLSGFNGASEAGCSHTSAALQAARVATSGDDASFPSSTEEPEAESCSCERAVPSRRTDGRSAQRDAPTAEHLSTSVRSSVDADAGRSAPTVRLRAKLSRRSIQRDGRKNSAPELPARHIPQRNL